MTTEQKLSMLESLCERVYEMGKDILDPNVKDAKKKIVAMTQVAGAFMGGYDSYKKRKDGHISAYIEDARKELKEKQDKK